MFLHLFLCLISHHFGYLFVQPFLSGILPYPYLVLFSFIELFTYRIFTISLSDFIVGHAFSSCSKAVKQFHLLDHCTQSQIRGHIGGAYCVGTGTNDPTKCRPKHGSPDLMSVPFTWNLKCRTPKYHRAKMHQASGNGKETPKNQKLSTT